MPNDRPGPNLRMRIDPELRAWLKEKAKADKRTETATMEIILRAVKDQEKK